MCSRIDRLCSALLLAALLFTLPAGPATAYAQSATTRFGSIQTNLADYPSGQVPTYEKLELTFTVETEAANVYWPYDASPPNGIEAGAGVSVDALFTPDDWQTVFIQPAFYYQEFRREIREGREWLYPTGLSTWKVRFAPNSPGQWSYKLRVQDAAGEAESSPVTFTVAQSDNRGFVRVSPRDPRYFEFDDGSYFPAMGVNLNLSALRSDMATLQENGMQLLRMWIPSQLGLFGAAWSAWRSYNPDHNTQEPDARIRHDAVPPFNRTPGVDPLLARPESETFLWLSADETVFDGGKLWNYTPCMVMGWTSPLVPVEPNRTYRVRVRYRDEGLTGPKLTGQPYGLAVKVGGWLWDPDDRTLRCDYPGVGEVLAASYGGPGWRTVPDPENPGWMLLEGEFNSGNRNFLDKLHLAVENATAGSVLVDHIWIQEARGNGAYGPNLVYKPWFAMHKYIDQRNAWVLDDTLRAAEAHDLFLKMVILEKQDYVLNIFDYDGSLSPTPPHQQSPPLFYGNGREEEGETKIRWLMKSYWRYLQARWGYSTAIHSWELLNEGSPGSQFHFVLTDELGKYMRTAFIPPGQRTPHPNTHLVSTSFWGNFPEGFWGGDAYPYVDFADVHHYMQSDSLGALDRVYQLEDFNDAAMATRRLSDYYGAKEEHGPGKPVIRGEVGWVFPGADLFAENRTGGLWLHNLVWGGINAGGLIEHYWTGPPTDKHIVNAGSHDHRPIYRTYFNFIRDLPLSNGLYVDAAAQVSNSELRVWGQKDMLNGRAHLWIQNRNHTWRNVADGRPIPPQSGEITLGGFAAGERYTLEWWDTRQPDPARQVLRVEQLQADGSGLLRFSVTDLAADVAVRLADANPGPEQLASPQQPVNPVEAPQTPQDPVPPAEDPPAQEPPAENHRWWLPNVLGCGGSSAALAGAAVSAALFLRRPTNLG